MNRFRSLYALGLAHESDHFADSLGLRRNRPAFGTPVIDELAEVVVEAQDEWSFLHASVITEYFFRGQAHSGGLSDDVFAEYGKDRP